MSLYDDNIFDEFFGNFGYKGNSYYGTPKYEISLRKSEFEKNLDDLYDAYKKFPIQYVKMYHDQVAKIKQYGCKVLRNSNGKHKIVC